MPPLISIIIPFFNEERNVAPLFEALAQATAPLTSYQFEYLFVDDGSTDRTWQVIEDTGRRDQRISAIQFTRNFGKEAATTAGIRAAQGQAIIIMDGDLQHPPALIPRMLEAWQKGNAVVIGERTRTAGDGYVKKIGSAIFYALVRRISDTPISPRSTDFRLLDRAVADEFLRLTEHARMTRGLIDWLGFPSVNILFEAQPRLAGTPRYGTWKLIHLAVSSVLSHSLFPLKLAGYLGIIIIMLSGPLGLFIFVERYLLNDPLGFNFSGPAILAVIILFLIGIVLAALGLIALYIGAIHTEVANRPLYVIKSKVPSPKSKVD